MSYLLHRKTCLYWFYFFKKLLIFLHKMYEILAKDIRCLKSISYLWYIIEYIINTDISSMFPKICQQVLTTIHQIQMSFSGNLNKFFWMLRKILINVNFFKKKFWRTWVLFVGPLISLLWTSGDIWPGFQSQVGSLTCLLLSPVCNGFLRFNSGVTPANLLAARMAACHVLYMHVAQ